MMLKTIGSSLFIAGAISSSAVVLPQVSLALGLTPLNVADFTLDGSTPTGIIDVAASPIGTLDTTAFDAVDRTQAAQAGLGGFNNFFTTGDFLAVGGLGTQTIGSSTRGANTRVNSLGFTLSAGDFTEDLLITFDFAFAGYIGRLATSQFNVQLFDGTNTIDFIAPVQLNNNAGQPSATNGRFRQTATTSVAGIIAAADLQAVFSSTPGTYFVSINVDEPSSSTTTNTVAGFQNISIQSVPVPFDFEPSLGIGLLGLGFGLNKVRKNLKAKKNTEV